MNKTILILMVLIASIAYAFNPIPKDQNNTPVYGGVGKPVFSEAVTLTTTSYASLLTLPTTGENENRMFRHFIIRNPDTARTVYICFGGTSSCSSDMLKIPPLTSYVLDHVYYGPLNDVTKIWGKLDSAGSVIPEITCW